MNNLDFRIFYVRDLRFECCFTLVVNIMDSVFYTIKNKGKEKKK